MPSATPPAEPGRLITTVPALSPARPRLSAAVGTVTAPRARIASAIPGSGVSSSGRVASGVASVGLTPVPPVVITSAGAALTACWRARAMSASAVTVTASTVSPRVRSQSASMAPVVSCRCPDAALVEATITRAVRGRTGVAGAPAGSGVAESRVQRPCLPPLFSSSRTSVRVAPGSTALIMSCSVSPATATAVSASISTPVRPVVVVVAVMAILSSPSSKATLTALSDSGWQSGINSLVRLAPPMPAIRAVASTSAFGRLSARTSAITSGLVSRRPSAMAILVVTALPLTSTIRARPSLSR